MSVPNLSLRIQCRKELENESAGILEKLAERHPDSDVSVREEALGAAVAVGCGSADAYKPKDAFHAEARDKRDQALESEMSLAAMRANNRAAVARFFQGTADSVVKAVSGATEGVSEAATGLFSGARAFLNV